MCQLKGCVNSKDHPECIALPKLLYNRLGKEWASRSLQEKWRAGRLWLPCLSKTDVESLLGKVPIFRTLRGELAKMVRYWDRAVLIDNVTRSIEPEGEIFFESVDGYHLHPI